MPIPITQKSLNMLYYKDLSGYDPVLRTYHFNKSFRELLRDERLAAANLLLTTTDFLVGEIAALVGIADEQHFNRLFKKERGVSPGQFRRANC